MKPEIVSSTFFICRVVFCSPAIPRIYIMFLFLLSFFLPLSRRRDGGGGLFPQHLLWLFYCCTISPADLHNGNTSESLTALDSELTPRLPVDTPVATAPLTSLCPCSAAGIVISKLWLIRLMEGSGGGDKNQEAHWVMEEGGVSFHRRGLEMIGIAGNMLRSPRECNQ